MEDIKISLAAARVNAGYSQADVSTILHIGKQTICNWEQGKVIPSFVALSALSNLYGIPIDNINLPKKST